MAQTEETRKAAGPFTTDKDQTTHEEDVQHLFTMVRSLNWVVSEHRADRTARFIKPTDNPKLQAIQLISCKLFQYSAVTRDPAYPTPPQTTCATSASRFVLFSF